MRDQINTYFLEMATKNKRIAHTEENPRYAGSYEQLTKLASGKMDLKNICLYLEGLSSKVVDTGADAYLKYKTCTFFLLRNATTTADQLMAYAQAESVLDELIAKMNFDRGQGTLMDFFRPGSVSYQEVGPELKAAYGLMVTFELLNPADQALFHDADNWLP